MKETSSAITMLDDIKANELHYAGVPENHIVIDFDIKDRKGMHLYYDYLKNNTK